MAVYPRKQTVVIFAICVIAVGGVAYSVYGRSADGIAQDLRVEPITTAADAGTVASNSDWQKQFLNTNTQSGDFKAAAKTGAIQKEEPLTPSDQLGRDFLIKYAELKQAGLTTDQQMVEQAMSQVAAASINNLASPKAYSMSNLKITTSETTVLNAYGKSILSTFRDYMPQQNEAVIADQIMTNGDLSQLSQLDPIITGYRIMIARLLDTPVPQPVAQYHLNLVNSISLSLYSAEAFRHIDTNPMGGLAAISLQTTALQNISLAFTNIQSYFISAGVPMRL
ncbi:MAG: hypothetical protein WCV82_01780 [Candidatus Paceibacterota bacterium]